MQQYFNQIIAKLTTQHTDTIATSKAVIDYELESLYKSIAAGIWDRICDTQNHLAEWERQNASDLVLVNGTLKATHLAIWPTIASSITFADKDNATIAVGIPAEEGRTLIETLTLLKGKAHEYLSQNTEYIIPDHSQPAINEQPSYSGC